VTLKTFQSSVPLSKRDVASSSGSQMNFAFTPSSRIALGSRSLGLLEIPFGKSSKQKYYPRGDHKKNQGDMISALV
jgi:hypothetical protein